MFLHCQVPKIFQIKIGFHAIYKTLGVALCLRSFPSKPRGNLSCFRENSRVALTLETNSKSISVLGKSEYKSYIAFQYGASPITSITSLAILSPDLDNTWKLIPKSKQTFKNFRVKFFVTCHSFQV